MNHMRARTSRGPGKGQEGRLWAGRVQPAPDCALGKCPFGPLDPHRKGGNPGKTDSGAMGRARVFGSKGPRSRKAPVRAGGARRDGGQMLLLSGVLLVLGFVILGTTLVQLQGMEGGTERTQRDNVMRTAEELVAGLNQTIQDSMVIGETNTTSFKETLRGAEASFRDNAVRAGLYASVQLVVDPPQDIFWRESRCMGYNPDASEGGIIVGWEEGSFDESIAGAVYHIHLTDGKQSFRTDLYVKLLDCARVEVFSHMRDAQPQTQFGHLKNHTHSRHLDGQYMNLTEEEDHETLIELQTGPSIREDSVTTNWLASGDFEELFNEYQYQSSASLTPRYVRWYVDPPPIMQPGDELSNVTVDLTAWRNFDPATLRPENLYLRVWYDNVLTPDIEILVPLTSSEDWEPGTEWENKNLTIELPNGPSGNLNWTYDEIINSQFEFLVKKEGIGHNSGFRIWADMFEMSGGLMSFAGYRIDATFEWQNVPPVYTDHKLQLRYNVTDATPEEGFHLYVRDAQVAGSPWSLLYNMTTTWGHGEWREAIIEEDEHGQPLPNHPEFRIVDSIHLDNWPVLDQDSVRIDLMRLISRLPGT